MVIQFGATLIYFDSSYVLSMCVHCSQMPGHLFTLPPPLLVVVVVGGGGGGSVGLYQRLEPGCPGDISAWYCFVHAVTRVPIHSNLCNTTRCG